MSKNKSEIKIGLVALSGILILIWGISFLKGKNIFTNTTHFYSIYEEVDGMNASAPVRINGFTVGKVTEVFFHPDNSGKIIVKFEMHKEFAIPKNSIANDLMQNSKKLDASSRNNLAASLRIKLSSKINYIKFMANTLVILGLIGTVIGFIIALSGVDGSVSSNPEEVSKMVSTLIQGMSVALYTTLVGSICSVWLNICYQIMSTGANKLLSKIIELGEKK